MISKSKLSALQCQFKLFMSCETDYNISSLNTLFWKSQNVTYFSNHPEVQFKIQSLHVSIFQKISFKSSIVHYIPDRARRELGDPSSSDWLPWYTGARNDHFFYPNEESMEEIPIWIDEKNHARKMLITWPLRKHFVHSFQITIRTRDKDSISKVVKHLCKMFYS